MSTKARYNVAPRYTPGSPAQVDRRTAEKVVEEERRAYEHVLTGMYGPEELERAERLGLGGIVEARVERARAWDVHDMITGKTFLRPIPR